jgi:hypothetical protein
VRVAIADLRLQPNIGEGRTQLLELCNSFWLICNPISDQFILTLRQYSPVFAKR